MAELKIRFKSDGLSLVGILHMPNARKPPLVIGSHGLMADKNSPKQKALALACNRLGMAFFRLDHRGCGESEGEFSAVTSLAGRCNDLKSAVEALLRRTDLKGTSVALFGSSFGGTVCMRSGTILNPSAIVVYGAPFQSRSLAQIPDLFERQPQNVVNAPVKLTNFDISDKVPKLHHILIIHGAQDEVVPVEHAKTIHDMAGFPKQLIIQENGDHPMSSTAHQRAFVRSASQWLFLYTKK